MRSGESTINRDDDYYRTRFNEINDKHFVRKTFISIPALITRQPVNGHRLWIPFHGDDYDREQFDIVNDTWEHEHCSICFFKIDVDYTYWASKKRSSVLCDECYDAFERHTERRLSSRNCRKR